MAIYNVSVSVGSSGSSGGSKADYLEREGKYKEKEWEDPEVEHIEHGHMPEWAEDPRRDYWRDAVDAGERANGVRYREVQVALPRELDRDRRRELAHEFAEHLTAQERLPYTLAIHRGGGDNPHAHLMISERMNDGLARTPETWCKRANRKHPERGGARKTRSLQGKRWLRQMRKDWETAANRALEKAGRPERIDSRSLADRRDAALARGDLEEAAEFSREPNVHLGPGAARAPGEPDTLPGITAKASSVEQHNAGMEWERRTVAWDLEKEKKRLAALEAQVRRVAAQIQRLAAQLVRLAQERIRSHERGWER